MNIDQELFNLSVNLESIAALTRSVLANLESAPDSTNLFREHWRDAGSLAFLIQDQVAAADKLLMDIINSYGEQQSVKVDVTASVLVATMEKQSAGDMRRVAI